MFQHILIEDRSSQLVYCIQNNNDVEIKGGTIIANKIKSIYWNILKRAVNWQLKAWSINSSLNLNGNHIIVQNRKQKRIQWIPMKEAVKMADLTRFEPCGSSSEVANMNNI